MLEALWFGRYASAVKYRLGLVKGQFRTISADHRPRHGDKLVFRYDDGTYTADDEQIGIRVSSSWHGTRGFRDPSTGQEIKQIQPTEQGLVSG